MRYSDDYEMPWLCDSYGDSAESLLDGDDRLSRLVRWLMKRKDSIEAFRWRRHLAYRYSWSLPSNAVLDRIAGHARVSGIVDVGAGTGYWASLLAARGVDVVAYDNEPPGAVTDGEKARWHGNQRRAHHPIVRADIDEIPWGDVRDRVMLLSWAPMDDMGARALRAFAEAGGNDVIVIGEGPSGCVGNEAMWVLLCGSVGLGWRSEDEDEDACRLANESQLYIEDTEAFAGVSIPKWDGLRDRVEMYRRKRDGS